MNKKNNNNVIKIAIIIVATIALKILLYVIGGFFIVWVLSPTIYDNIKDYEICLEENLYYLSDVKHFPKAIPDNAKDVKLYCNPSDWDGLVLLRFKADKIYIESELNKYEFLNKADKVGKFQKTYNMHPEIVELNPEDITYYALKTKDNEIAQQRGYFPYYSGIGVSKNMDYILYYAINPD